MHKKIHNYNRTIRNRHPSPWKVGKYTPMIWPDNSSPRDVASYRIVPEKSGKFTGNIFGSVVSLRAWATSNFDHDNVYFLNEIKDGCLTINEKGNFYIPAIVRLSSGRGFLPAYMNRSSRYITVKSKIYSSLETAISSSKTFAAEQALDEIQDAIDMHNEENEFSVNPDYSVDNIERFLPRAYKNEISLKQNKHLIAN